MSPTRPFLTFTVLLAATAAAAAKSPAPAGKPTPSAKAAEADPLWPTNQAPHDWPTNPGTRYEMADFVRLVAPADIVIRARIPGWRTDEMGTFRVGDQFHFDAILAERTSLRWGSVKDGRDGGKLTTTVYWMDEAGKVAKTDPDIVKGGCVCSGVFSLYLNIPSSARTARHRLNLHYVNARLKMDVSKDLFFDVLNDGTWKQSPLLEALAAKHPAVATLQNGLPCPELDITGYAGTHDTYMHATHNVPDRNSDHANYGTVTYLQVGTYGQAKRALLKFELGNLRAKSPLAEAYLQVYCYSLPGGQRGAPPELVAYEVLKDWQAGRGTGTYLGYKHEPPPIVKGEASWLYQAYPAKWSAPGCGGAGIDRSAAAVGAASRPKTSKEWVTVKLDAAMVQRWIDQPATNRGLLLQDPHEGGKGEGAAYYRSAEYEDPAMRPRLVLAFSAKPPLSPACTPTGCPAR